MGAARAAAKRGWPLLPVSAVILSNPSAGASAFASGVPETCASLVITPGTLPDIAEPHSLPKGGSSF